MAAHEQRPGCIARSRGDQRRCSAAHTDAAKAKRRRLSVQTWNPFEPPGSEAARSPRRDRALPKEYCRPEVQDVPDESTASNNNNASPFGSYANPFVVDEDDIPSSARSGPIGSTTGSRPAQPPPTPTTPRRGNAGQPTQTPLAAAPRTPGGRRKEPKGIYLGTRSGSELSGSQSNAVYGSKDRLGRINRRISKEDNAGNVITAGNFDPRVTACKHEDIRYIQRLQGLTRSQVDSMINPMLVVGGGVLALPAPPVASSRAPLRLTWIDLSSAASDDD